MELLLDVASEVVSLATALGAVRHGQFDPSFLSSPLDHLTDILQDHEQRRELLRALRSFLPPADAMVPSRGRGRQLHPLSKAGAHGRLSLSVDVSDSAGNLVTVLGLLGEARDFLKQPFFEEMDDTVRRHFISDLPDTNQLDLFRR